MSQSSTPGLSQPLSRRGDAIQLCTGLEETVARLADLMEQETALLADNRHQDIIGLQDEKIGLSRDFLRQFTAFKANAAFIGANAPSQTDRIRRILRTFGQTIERNLNALDAARAVSQGIVQAMFTAASKANSGPTRYGRNAAMNADSPARPTALALDRSL